MTEDDVVEAMRLNSPALVAEVYETTRRNADNYNQKHARLDSKATTLLSVIGLSLTVVFTYGGQLVLGQANVIKALGRGRWLFLTTSFSLAALAGICAGICAAAALLVRDHAEMTDRNIYDAKALREADVLEHEEQNKGVADYRRSLTIHMWSIVKQRESKLGKKAGWIQAGQICFFAFLALLAVVFVEIVSRMA